MNFRKRQEMLERSTNMTRTHLIAVFVGLAAICIFASDASAYYDPGMGRFLSRDPGPGGAMGTPQIAIGGPAVGGGFLPRDPINTGNQPNMTIAAYPGVGQIAPAANTGPVYVGGVAAPQPQGRIIRRDPVERTSYADGPNLYQYVRSNPQVYVDPYGLMARNEWDKCCKDTFEADRQLAHYRTAAMAIDGYDYGSLMRGEWGCGWCAGNILGLLSSTKSNKRECWDFNWYSGTKYMIGTGWAQLPDVVLKHQFVALRKNIDGMSVGDPYNADSPVFDGWGGLWGNLSRKCKFSEGTVGAYSKEWLFWRVEP